MAGPFTYLNNIPQATDQLSVSQGQILTNFASIDSLIDVNHVDFSSPDAGKHTRIDLVNQTGTPTPSGTDVVVYNKASSGVQQVYVNTGATAIPMTQYGVAVANTQSGWTYLPSGIKMAWAQVTVIQSISNPFVFSSTLFGTGWTDFVGTTVSGQATFAQGFAIPTTNITTAPFVSVNSVGASGIDITSNAPGLVNIFVIGY